MKRINKHKVIDSDNSKILENFDKTEAQEKLAYYESIGKWNDISVDLDGDIIL